MSEIDETIQEAVEHAQKSRLNSLIALLVAVSATFMALCNVKDGNIVQSMEEAQARSIDQWAYYQAKGTKQNLAEQMVDQLALERELLRDATPTALALVERENQRLSEQKQTLRSRKESNSKERRKFS